MNDTQLAGTIASFLLALGAFLKNYTPLRNDWIPAIVVPSGLILMIVGTQAWLDVNIWIQGLMAGFAAVGVHSGTRSTHQAVKATGTGGKGSEGAARLMLLILLTLIIIPTSTMMMGCAATRQLETGGVYSGDRILFTSEATTPKVYDTVNSFLAWEERNRLPLWNISKDIKGFADDLRRDFPEQKQRADELHDLYQATRSEEHRADLAAMLRILEDILIEIASYQAEAAVGGVAGPPPIQP